MYQNELANPYKLPLSTLIQYFQLNFTNPTFEKSIVTAAEGQNVVLEDTGLNRWLLLRPNTALASAGCVLPSPDMAADGQAIRITSTMQITTFTVDGNGSTVNGAPTALAADDAALLIFEKTTAAWYGLV